MPVVIVLMVDIIVKARSSWCQRNFRIGTGRRIDWFDFKLDHVDGILYKQRPFLFPRFVVSLHSSILVGLRSATVAHFVSE